MPLKKHANEELLNVEFIVPVLPMKRIEYNIDII